MTACYAIRLSRYVTSCLVKWEFPHKKDDHNKWHGITLPGWFPLFFFLVFTWTYNLHAVYLHITAVAQINFAHMCALLVKSTSLIGFNHFLPNKTKNSDSQYASLISILHQCESSHENQKKESVFSLHVDWTMSLACLSSSPGCLLI